MRVRACAWDNFKYVGVMVIIVCVVWMMIIVCFLLQLDAITLYEKMAGILAEKTDMSDDTDVLYGPASLWDVTDR